MKKLLLVVLAVQVQGAMGYDQRTWSEKAADTIQKTGRDIKKAAQKQGKKITQKVRKVLMPDLASRIEALQNAIIDTKKQILLVADYGALVNQAYIGIIFDKTKDLPKKVDLIKKLQGRFQSNHDQIMEKLENYENLAKDQFAEESKKETKNSEVIKLSEELARQVGRCEFAMNLNDANFNDLVNVQVKELSTPPAVVLESEQINVMPESGQIDDIDTLLQDAQRTLDARRSAETISATSSSNYKLDSEASADDVDAILNESQKSLDTRRAIPDVEQERNFPAVMSTLGR